MVAYNIIKSVFTKACKLGKVTDTGIVEVLADIISKKSKLFLLVLGIFAIEIGFCVIGAKLSSNDSNWSMLFD